MKLRNVQTRSEVFGPGSLADSRTTFVGDGQNGSFGRLDLRLDRNSGMVIIRSPKNGKVRLVPHSNIAGMEPWDSDFEAQLRGDGAEPRPEAPRAPKAKARGGGK